MGRYSGENRYSWAWIIMCCTPSLDLHERWDHLIPSGQPVKALISWQWHMEVYTAVTHTSTSGVSMTYDRIREKVKGPRKYAKCKRMSESGSICEQIINLSQIFSVSSDHKSTLKDLFRRKNSLYFLKLQWMEKSDQKKHFWKELSFFSELFL